MLQAQEECQEVIRFAEQEKWGGLHVVATRKEWLAYIYGLLGDEAKFKAQTMEAIRDWEAIQDPGRRTEGTSLGVLRNRLAAYDRTGVSAIPNWGACA